MTEIESVQGKKSSDNMLSARVKNGKMSKPKRLNKKKVQVKAEIGKISKIRKIGKGVRGQKKRIMVMKAPIWKRIGAMFFDLLLLDIVVLLPFRKKAMEILPELGTAGFVQIADKLSANPEMQTMLSLYSLISSILILLYFVLLEYKLGQTPGKMIFKLRVVPESKDVKPTLMTFIIRNLNAFPIFPFFIMAVVDPLYMLMKNSQQRLSEKWSKTRVVEELCYSDEDYAKLAGNQN